MSDPILALVIWSLIQRDYPWARTICWLALALYLVFVNAGYDLGKTMFPWVRPWIFWGFLLIVGAWSLRGLYREPSSVNGLEQTKLYREAEPDLEQLAALHPATWQIITSDDFYPMYLRLYLVEHNSSEGVLWNKGKAVGDIIFLPAIYDSYFPKEGYVLWGRRELTMVGNFDRDLCVKTAVITSGILTNPGDKSLRIIWKNRFEKVTS